MKKIVVLLISVLMTVSIYGQEHLKFKGIPMDGPIKTFSQKLHGKGLSFDRVEQGWAVHKGTFAGFDNCEIYVGTQPNRDCVTSVIVLFPVKENWNDLLYDYEHLKSLLTEKYGTPAETVEHFDDRDIQTTSFSSMKMYALKDSEVQWYTIFSTELGYLKLAISYSDGYGASTTLLYFDQANGKKIYDDVIDDL